MFNRSVAMYKIMLSCSIFCVLILHCTSTTPLVDTASENDPELSTEETLTLGDSIQQPLYTIQQNSKSFTTDKLNQLYLITPKNEVIKYDITGKEVFRYNNNFLENLSHIDATDPFNLLLYYPDYLSIITLDRTMTQTGIFDLSTLDLIRVNAVGASNDNNVWLFDEVTFQLKKVNRNAEILRQSVDINLQLNHPPTPVFLLEKENNVYVNDPTYGIFIFNMFGEYESIIELKGVNSFQLLDNRLFYKKGKNVFSYHIQTFDQRKIRLPTRLEITDDILIQKNRLFVRKADRIEVYTL